MEDNPADVFLIRETIEATGLNAEVHIARDGEEATRFFDEADQNDSAPCPAMVILDINLPKKGGGEILKHLRQSRRCGTAAVIAVSTSQAARDREAMLKGGANAYFRKPSEYEAFLKLSGLILEWFPKAPKA